MAKYKMASVFSWIYLLLVLVCPSGSQAREENPNPYNTPQQAIAFEERTRQFGRLWLSRRQRKVTSQLLQMLAAESSPNLKERIIVALGRIEDPQAQSSLQILLKQAKVNGAAGQFNLQGNQIHPIVIQLALGRIKARNLKGIIKLNIIAREIGKNWVLLKQDARLLRLKLKNRMGIYQVQGSENKLILDEFYDVLYRMGKNGENLRALGGYDLILWPQQKIVLDTAMLSDQAEQKFWLDRAQPPISKGFYTSRILDLNLNKNNFLKILKLTLIKVQKNPSAVEKNRSIGCQSLFATAVALNDMRALPLLIQFSKTGDRNIRFTASSAIDQLKSKRGLSSVQFP